MLQCFYIKHRSSAVDLKCSVKAYNFIKKRFRHRCFPFNFVKFFQNTFFIERFKERLRGLSLKEPAVHKFSAEKNCFKNFFVKMHTTQWLCLGCFLSKLAKIIWASILQNIYSSLNSKQLEYWTSICLIIFTIIFELFSL